MQAEFYQFRLPEGWEPFMCFNYSVVGDRIGLDPQKLYRPSCRVLPVGWTSFVGIMQQISKQVLLMRGLSPDDDLQKMQGIPRWFTQTAAQALRAGKYLGNQHHLHRPTSVSKVLSPLSPEGGQKHQAPASALHL